MAKGRSIIERVTTLETLVLTISEWVKETKDTLKSIDEHIHQSTGFHEEQKNMIKQQLAIMNEMSKLGEKQEKVAKELSDEQDRVAKGLLDKQELVARQLSEKQDRDIKDLLAQQKAHEDDDAKIHKEMQEFMTTMRTYFKVAAGLSVPLYGQFAVWLWENFFNK